MRQKYCILYIIILGGFLNFSVYSSEPSRIIFLGDSLTAGYSLNAEEAYPALIQSKIDERKWPFRVINSGISGDTTAGGLRRLDWLMRQPFSVLVVALGANDGLRGFDPALSKKNLSAIISKARERFPDVTILLAGMKLPGNMGEDYAERFERIFPELAGEHEVAFMPFLLEGVAGNPALNLPDGIHPTPSGQQIIADTMWPYLEPLLSAHLQSNN